MKPAKRGRRMLSTRVRSKVLAFASTTLMTLMPLAVSTLMVGCSCDDEPRAQELTGRELDASGYADTAASGTSLPGDAIDADSPIAESDAGATLPEAFTDAGSIALGDSTRQTDGPDGGAPGDAGPTANSEEQDDAAMSRDASGPTISEPRLLECASLPPAMAYDQVALVDGDGLWLTPLHGETLSQAVTWPREFTPNRPVADPTEPGFVVSGSDGTLCALRAVDELGQTRFAREFSALGCQPAVPSQHGWLLASTALDGSGQLRLLDFADGAELDRAALAARPTSTPAQAQSGGSHWVIGTGDQIALATTEPGALSLLGAAATQLSTVQQIAALPAVAALPNATGPLVIAASRDGLARYELDLSNGALQQLGSVITTPASIRAPLVASDECGDRSGGSHWWCDGGVLATGGDGWLAAWKLTDGQLWFAHALEENITSLALTADGVLTSGGSHWLPRREDAPSEDAPSEDAPSNDAPSEGQWRMRAIDDPTAEPTLTLDEKITSEICVAGPVLDTEGSFGMQLMTAQSSELVRVGTRASGLATGFSRGGGNNAGSAMPTNDQASCRESSQRLYERFFSPDGDVTLGALVSLAPAAQPGADSASFVLGGRRDGAWVAGVGPAGRVLWELEAPPDALAPSFDVLLGMGDRTLATALTSGETEPVVTTLVVSAEGTNLGQAEFEVANSSDVVAATAEMGRQHLVGNLQGAVPEGADVWIAEVDTLGAPLSVVSYASASFRRAFGASAIPGSTDLLVFGGDDGLPGATAWVARVTNAGDEVWTHEQTTANLSLFAIDAHVGAGGEILLAVVNGESGLLSRYAGDGTFLSSTPLPGLRPVALAEDAQGSLGLVTRDASLYRVGAGAVHLSNRLPIDVGIDASASRAVALVAAPEFGWLVGASIAEPDGSGSAFFARTDHLGRSGCAEAGQCVTTSAPSCAALAECSIEACDPSSGQCASDDVPDGTRCSPTDICSAGSCGPAPELSFPQTIDANDCFAVQSYAECVPGSLAYANLLLNDDGTLVSLEPAATGSWTQPSGEGSLEMLVEGAQGGDEWILFSGESVDDFCYEGTIQTNDGLDGAFRACKN